MRKVVRKVQCAEAQESGLVDVGQGMKFKTNGKRVRFDQELDPLTFMATSNSCMVCFLSLYCVTRSATACCAHARVMALHLYVTNCGQMHVDPRTNPGFEKNVQEIHVLPS